MTDEDKDEYTDMTASTESHRSVFSREPKAYSGTRERTTSISVRKTEFELEENKKASCSFISRVWKTFDDGYMRPLLTSSKPTLIETLPGCCAPCARLFTSHEQMESSSSRKSSDPNEVSELLNSSNEQETLHLSYTETGGGSSMVCSHPSKTSPLLDQKAKIPDYNAGFTS